MTEKISFAIDNAEMIDENPNSSFAVLSVDFFASGENLHDMYVSPETLMRTADTIKNVPMVWKYDKVLDDIGTHDKDESPIGFVPEKTDIKSRVLPDGRIMLSAIAYVWKKYTGEILSFFKRDGGEKPVSVEISVFSARDLANGMKELLDYRFEAITVLGSFVSPAIPGAKSTVLSFADISEYNSLVKKEFGFAKYSDIDFSVPEIVKSNIKTAMSNYKIVSDSGSVIVAFSKNILKNGNISLENIKYLNKDFSEFGNDTSPFFLLGGNESLEWSKSICEQIENADKNYQNILNNKEESMPYSSLKDINPALKGLGGLSLEQANGIAKQADAVGGEYGWPTAIKSFKERHIQKDGKWIEKNNKEMSMDKKDEEVSAAKDTEEKETPAEENKETPEEENKENKAGTEKKFEFPKNFNASMLMSMFSAEDDNDEDIKMAKDELTKEFADPSVVMAAMYSKMCKMASAVAEMAKEKETYMAENENLKKFKSDVDGKDKMFAIKQTLAAIEDKFIVSPEARDAMIAESGKYDYANIGVWENYCKALSFDFAVKQSSTDDAVTRVALPFINKSGNDNVLWTVK